jgi:Protein of unknown function (DUF1236)
MRRILIPAIAGCVLAAYAAPLSAQGPGGREGPGAGPPGGGQPGGMRSPGPGGAGPQREMNAPRAPQSERGPGVDRPGRAEGPPRGIERNRQVEPQQPNRQRERATEREQNRAAGEQRSEQRRNAERERNAERARSAEQERSRSEQRRNAERERNAERTRSAERERAARDQKRVEDRQRQRAEQPDRRDRQAGDRVKGGDRVTERREEMRRARDRLGPNERQRLHAGFDFRGARVTNARFDRHVGHRVPRHVRLFPVSREIISFFPYYRDYSYVVVDDEICIVDPRTYEIVDVIDQGYYRGAPRQEVAGLTLSSAQVAFVRDSIPRDFPETRLRLRLALGAEVPGDVELYEFPVIVLDRIRELRDYRFLVVEEQIVIVDPRDRSIALVIDRV